MSEGGGPERRAGLGPGWPAEPSFSPRMNQQLQTKAMALLTALVQGATPAERKVGVHPVTGWGGQEVVGAVLRAVGRKNGRSWWG